MKKCKPISFKDPINGELRVVRSIYKPKKTLLQGAAYSRYPKILHKANK